MSEKVVEGALSMLGQNKSNSRATTYSTIEIGDQILQKVVVPNVLTDYLERGLKFAEPMKLYMQRNVVYGFQLPDGRTFTYKRGPGAMIAFFCLGALTAPYVIGLFIIYGGVQEWKLRKLTGTLAAQGATVIDM